VIHEALGRAVPIELTDDRRIRHRVLRLAAVSLVALGLVCGLGAATLDAPPVIVASLALGWVLMPTVLAWSLREPRARYLLVVPSSLVTLGLLAICLGWMPTSEMAAAGWLLMTIGVALGGVLGLWLWFRLMPVPAALDDPLAPGRWALIAVHVALVGIGWALAATALLD
jgi:FtsH-binding integral membrane protein